MNPAKTTILCNATTLAVTPAFTTVMTMTTIRTATTTTRILYKSVRLRRPEDGIAPPSDAAPFEHGCWRIAV